jgi:cell division protein FtsW
MCLISIQNRKTIEKFLMAAFLISIFFLVLVPFIGVEVKGSKRWIDFPYLPRFQPIELVKPFFVIMLAKIIVLNKDSKIYVKYLKSLLILFFIVFLLVNQPDLGQTLLIFFSWIITIFVSGINIIVLSLFMFLSCVAIFFLIYFFPQKFGYVFARLQTFLNPKEGDNFQSEKALDAIRQGGLTGQGMGEGVLKDRVPEAHTDYIIAVVSEEYGVLMVFFIMLLFLFISYKVLNKIFTEEEEFVKLILVGLISLIILQTLIHIGVNVRLFPTTGMTLPFLSYGGSSLVSSSIIAGIILNYTKQTPRKI